ncbi:MAG TPA: hypothetical protein PLP48_08965 [Acholeplasmataceae bacterium]|nr:hypothetical protein [Acholeplasmataceae bacterium]
MNRCKLCGCTDLYACKGGCFWVDKEKTICSSCAIINEVKFKNVVNGAIATIIDANYESYGMSATVTINYEDKRKFTISLFDFLYHYQEVKL